MNESARLVSVGLPTYNRLDRLRVAVDSVLAQDHAELELVISDNASTDGTEAYGRRLEQEHPGRVRYLRNPQNVGAVENFNRARAAARGEYVMWLGDDDELGPGCVSACLATLDERPDAAMVSGLVRYVDGDRAVRLGDVVVCDGPDGAQRVREYYAQVGDNGTFYGLTRRSVADRLEPLTGVMGGDWYLMAAIAYLGPTLMADDAEIRRSTGGATRSLKHVARSSGMSWFEGEFPQLALAGLALRDIAWASPVYRSMGRGARLVLGLRVAATIVRRFVVPAVPRYGRLLAARIRSRRRPTAEG